ncbi:MAG: hypothetical protein Q9217_005077 [Psora testacea]
MPDLTPKRPINWEDYEYGRSPRQGSTGSLGSHVQFEASSLVPGLDHSKIPRRDSDSENASEVLRLQRSSLSMRINSLAQAGGPNSIENFARSWSRAAGFAEIPPHNPSFVISEGGAESLGSRQSDDLPSPPESRSLLRQQLQREETSSEAAIDDQITPHNVDEEAGQTRQLRHSTPIESQGISDRTPYLASPFASSYGGVYGSLSSRANGSPMRHAGLLHHEQQAKGQHDLHEEQEPLLIKVIDQKDGMRVQVVIGQSTLPQTVFNSVNVLIGVGLLSLPLGIKQSGWLIGMGFLFCAALVTRYTAGLLAKCLDLDHSLITFSDIAWKAYGCPTRIATGFLFSFELVAACVALVVLFADSLDALFPGWGTIEWKVLCGIILVPLSFVPLRSLSVSSVLGIFCCLGIVTLIFVDGIVKPYTPGSLREPAAASLFPKRWSDLPLSFGLLMSPWGGHSVFPNIYRDMRHPRKYTKAINYTYVFTYLLDIAVAVAGYLMFGQNIMDEVTSNIFLTDGYPHAVSVCMVVFIAIIPLTKVPLNARPIFVFVEDFIGLNSDTLPSFRLLGLASYTRSFLRSGVRLVIIIVIILLAILVPSFDTVMALLGSAMAFSICIILPVAFHLKLFYKELGELEKALHWFLIITCSILAVLGTVWVFLPKHVLDEMDGVA